VAKTAFFTAAIESTYEGPSSQPSAQPSGQPTSQPSAQPSGQPSTRPSNQPSAGPSSQRHGKSATSQPLCGQARSLLRSHRVNLRRSVSSLRGSLRGQPTSQPSAQPSGQPSTRPSNRLVRDHLRSHGSANESAVCVAKHAALFAAIESTTKALSLASVDAGCAEGGDDGLRRFDSMAAEEGWCLATQTADSLGTPVGCEDGPALADSKAAYSLAHWLCRRL